jgi:DNA-binding NarL/FixJ family response regulator
MKMKTDRLHCPVPQPGGFTARPIRTFLAEDTPFLMALLARIVSKNQKFSIVGSATDDRKALWNASTLQLDLVVTDLHMPGMDGAEVARRLKQLPNPPIVFIVTSDDTPEARAMSVAAGADAFVVKAGNLAPRLLSAIQEFFPDDLDENDSEPKHFYEKFTRVK